MKSSLGNNIIVWFFVLLGLVLFVGFSYMMGGNKGSYFAPYYTYKTEVLDATGMEPGERVSLHGTKTGNITKIDMKDSGQVEVSFTVKKSHSFAINQTSFIEVKSKGLLGMKAFNIVTKDLSLPPLKKGSTIPTRTAPDFLSRFLGGKNQDTSSSILDEIDKTLKKLNKKGVAGVVTPGGDKELKKALRSLNSILKKVDTGKGTLGALVNDKEVYNRVLKLLGKRSTKNYLDDLSQKPKKK